MQHSFRSARPAAALALAVGLALAVPGTAFAGTTEPTPATTTTAPTPEVSTTTSGPTGTSTESTTTSPDPSTTTTTGPTSSTTTPPTATSTTAAPASKAARPATKAVTEAQRTALAALATPQSDAAAAFIARTLADADDHYNYPESTFFDGGNTIDAILALDATGGQTAQADATYAYLVAHLGDYVGTGGETYAGPLGKALLAVVAHGGDASDVAGQDLVTRLADLEGSTGRFSDASAFGDYSNTIGQALDLLALTRAGAPLTAASVDYLLEQQCSDGGFRGALGGPGCTSDPDATAFALQALVAADSALLCGSGADTVPARVDAAIGDGLDQLESLQGPTGGFDSSDGTPNANTSGVAAQALYAGGRDAAADDAAGFIVGLQYDGSAPTDLQGGIAYSASTRSTTTPSDSDLRATPQATLALTGRSLVDVLAADAQEAPRVSTCPAAPSTTTRTTTTTTSAVPSASPAASGGADPSDDPASAVPGALAFTGTDVAATVLLAIVFLAVGALALVLSRRRGAHA